LPIGKQQRHYKKTVKNEVPTQASRKKILFAGKAGLCRLMAPEHYNLLGPV
jgi:hypothetical protein